MQCSFHFLFAETLAFNPDLRGREIEDSSAIELACNFIPISS